MGAGLTVVVGDPPRLRSSMLPSSHLLRGLAIAAIVDFAQAIGVEEGLPGHKHVHGEIDPDEYLWSKLPGRCCFEMNEICPTPDSPRSLCKKEAAKSCKECSVWSTPENYCHTNAENCHSCGMPLYCGAPPPLLDGNKVCTGSSRVGTGCFDDMATGMCASANERDCEDACRDHPECELYVYYPAEMKGSCVLCSDLFSMEKTVESATRAYAVTEAKQPPSPPGTNLDALYAVLSESPKPPPAAPSSGLLPTAASALSHLGRHKTGKSKAHVDCSFVDGVEYTTTKQTGYSDRLAKTKEECCELCGHLETGCSHFVFEPTSGTCVLLPVVSSGNELESDDNPMAISGTASVGTVAVGADAFPTSSCSFTASAGFTSGSIGLAPPLPGGLMNTHEDCCRSCGVTAECAKFTFSEGDKKCTMYASFAEMVMVNDLTAGTIRSKQASFNTAGFNQATGEGFGGTQQPMFAFMPPMPDMPGFAKLVMRPPPPPPSRREDSVTEDLIRDISIGVGGAIIMSFFLAIYCFFSPQLLTLLHEVTGGRAGKMHVRAQKVSRVDEDDDDDDGEDNYWGAETAVGEEEPRRKPRRGRRPRKHGHNRDSCGADDRHADPDDRGGSGGRGSRHGKGRKARLMVRTPAITQSRDVCVAECEDLEELKAFFFDEFHSVLKDLRSGQTQLFCLAPDESSSCSNADPQMMWFLVTKRSEFERVVQCAAFRLQDKQCDEGQSNNYKVAFEGGRRAAGRRPRTSRPQGQGDPVLLLGYNPQANGNGDAAPWSSAATACKDSSPSFAPLPPQEDVGRRRGVGADGASRRPGRTGATHVSSTSLADAEDANQSGGSSEEESAARRNGSGGGGRGTHRSAINALALPPATMCLAAPPPRVLPPPPATLRVPPRPLPQCTPCTPCTQCNQQALTPLSSAALDQLSTQLPGCNTLPLRSAKSEVNAWDEDEADLNGRVSRSRQAAIADELLE